MKDALPVAALLGLVLMTFNHAHRGEPPEQIVVEFLAGLLGLALMWGIIRGVTTVFRWIRRGKV
jgi:cytochrome b